MRVTFLGNILFLSVGVFLTGCQPQAVNTNVNSANANSNKVNSAVSNSNTNSSNVGNNTVSSVPVEVKEPEQYQAKVTLKIEAEGANQTTALPAVTANVARNASDRVMEFNLPNGEKVIYLDKAGTNYLILPNKKQYAELNKDSIGFDVRRLMMPEQIANQIKAMPGIQRIGEENVNGRAAVKYSYSATASTQTQAGNVSTNSFILVDKETGLPLHSETVSQSQTGANVQGYKGLRLVTDLSDIQPAADSALFVIPPDYQKIDSAQVKAQADLIFNAITLLIGQTLKQMSAPTASPMAPVAP